MKNPRRARVDKSVCIDLGGTNMRIALVGAGGEILRRARFVTHADRGWRDIVERMARGVKELVATEGTESCTGVGVGVPGALLHKEGVVIDSPNLPGWHKVPLRRFLRDRLHCPVVVENDADAAALGEGCYGAARGIRNYLGITLGTGVGGGLVLDGKLWRGPEATAGEVGHFPVETAGFPCGCGSHGCLETVASATGIVRMALEAGRDTEIRRLSGDSVANIDAEVVSRAARQGDRVAQGIFHRMAVTLAMVLAGIVNLLQLEALIIGGGVAASWDCFGDTLRQEMQKRLFSGPPRDVRILQAELGDDAGILGMARRVFEETGVPIG
ncbi:MAG: ROK family protein [Deltaproteobacteria bacterium]|nr:ROK family protein [Deltaproteobacteria bacterium]